MSTDMISNTTSPSWVAMPNSAEVTTSKPLTSSKATEVAQSSSSSKNTEETTRKASDPLEISKAVEKIAEFVSSRQSELSFSIDDTSHTPIVKVTDTTTKQVIRQFPSEEAIAIAHALDKIQGLLIKDKV